MEESDRPQLQRAVEYSNKKIFLSDFLQGLGLLAVAEAIHRLADVVESTDRPK